MPAPVILTRSPEDNRELARLLEERGIPARECPCIDCRVVRADPVGEPIDAVAFTSRMGVRGFFENGLDRDLIPRHVGSVGNATADEIRKHGWTTTLQPERPTADDLARLFCSTLRCGERVLWARGNLATETFALVLKEGGIELVERRVYANYEPDVDTVDACSTVVVASPSAVRRFLTANPHCAVVPFVAIGSRTAAAARDAGVATVVESAHPTAEEIVRAVLAVLPPYASRR